MPLTADAVLGLDDVPAPSLTTAAPRLPSAVGRTCAGIWLILTIALPYLGLAVLNRLWIRHGPLRERLDSWSARAFVRFARQHGALMIKVGQFIATRPDLFPLTWITLCADLRDQAPARTLAEVEQVLREAYQGQASPFVHFEPLALAAASFGQVHRATLGDGRRVAVKVQHLGLERLVAIDMSLVRCSLRLMRLAMPGFPFHDLAEELERTSRAELDYLQEAASMDRLRPRLQAHGLDAPAVIWEHTRQSVLVMEFAAGQTLARMDLHQLPQEQRQDLATRIIDAFLGMLLEEGFYHADPHGGNFILDGTRLTLIDFGMTGTITPRQAELYRRFLGCVQRRDIDGMIELMLRLGFVLPALDRDQLRRLAQTLYESVAEVAPQSLRGSKRRWEIGRAINEVLLQSKGLIFPHHTIMLSRATGMLEGLCAELVPETSILSLARPILERRLTPLMRVRHALQEVRELWTTIGGLPDRLALLKRGPDYTAQAVVAGCVFIAALQLPPGHLRIIALVAGGIAALRAVIKHRP